MLTLLGTIFGSIFSGGATGLLGVVLQRFADYQNKKLDMQLEAQRAANEIAKRRVDAEIMAQEWAGRLKVAETEGDTAKDVAASKAFEASLFKEPERYTYAPKLTTAQQWVMVLLDAARGLVRPFLTIYLCALTTYVWFQVRQTLTAEDLSTDAALDVWKMVVGQILYLTTTVVLWWFGTRNRQDAPKIKL